MREPEWRLPHPKALPEEMERYGIESLAELGKF